MTELRITGGELGGRKLISRAAAPRQGGSGPTTDRVREALFSILGDISDLQRARPLLRHGRARRSRRSRAAPTRRCSSTRRPRWRERNVEELGLERRCEVVRGDAIRYARARCEAERFDLVLCDPPYRLADPP